MKRTLLLLLFISSFCYGQTAYDKHDELIAKANTLKEEGNYQKAIESYQGALEVLIPNSSTPFFNLAECALHLDDLTLAEEWIRKGVSMGGATKTYLREYKGFANIKTEDFYKKIVSDYKKLRQEYFSTIEDLDLYLEIEKLVARDQFVRKAGMYLDGISDIDYQNAGTEYRKALQANHTISAKEIRKVLFHKTKDEHNATTSELMRKVDSLNIAKLIEITKEHGWQERAWVILWHQRGTYGEDNYIWNYFKPQIDKEIEAGNLSRNFWKPFDQFKQPTPTGNFGTFKVGEKPKTQIKVKENKN